MDIFEIFPKTWIWTLSTLLIFNFAIIQNKFPIEKHLQFFINLIIFELRIYNERR